MTEQTTLVTETIQSNSDSTTPTTKANDQASSVIAGQANQKPSQSESKADIPESKEGTKQENQAKAPEKYEFKAPEGKEYDPAFLDAYSEVAKELNLTQGNAQKMIDTLSLAVSKSQTERIETIRNDWAESSKADKEFGGDKLNENLAMAKVAIDQFGTPELKQLMNETGIGNHPELIRFFFRAGKALSSDTFVGGHKESVSPPKNFSGYADSLYGIENP